MTVHDDRPGDDGGHRPTPAGRPSGHRKQVVAGVVGLAAVLGVGSYLVTAHLIDRNDTAATGDTGAIGAFSPPASQGLSAGGPSTSASAAASRPAPAKSRPKPSPAAADDATKEVQAARDAARKDGVALQRPLTPQPGTVDGLSTRTEKTAQGTIRITSAKGDLTGRQDQLMAADSGKPVGKAHCTQRLHFSNAAEPREIPTVMLCWRTSSSRSVVTLAVSPKGNPSADASVAAINREWARLR